MTDRLLMLLWCGFGRHATNTSRQCFVVVELRGTRSYDQVVKRVSMFRKLAVAPSLALQQV